MFVCYYCDNLYQEKKRYDMFRQLWGKFMANHRILALVTKKAKKEKD
jgi:hypothetical protein